MLGVVLRMRNRMNARGTRDAWPTRMEQMPCNSTQAKVSLRICARRAIGMNYEGGQIASPPMPAGANCLSARRVRWPGVPICVSESSTQDFIMQIAIRFADCTDHAACTLCGEQSDVGPGPRLYDAETEQHVCRECGKRSAPHLLALLDLANAADRVGRTCRFVVPPMEALLDLARAAEKYATVKEKHVKPCSTADATP